MVLTYHYFLSSLTFWDCKWDPLPLRWICLWPSFYFPLPLFDNPIVSWWHPITKSWAVEHPISCTLSNSSHSLQQISNACTLCTVRTCPWNHILCTSFLTYFLVYLIHILGFIVVGKITSDSRKHNYNKKCPKNADFLPNTSKAYVI